MKTTVTLILFFIILVYVSKPIIQFKPFSISFEQPYMPFGVLFLVLALSCFQIQAKKDARKQLIEDINSKLEEVKSEIKVKITN